MEDRDCRIGRALELKNNFAAGPWKSLSTLSSPCPTAGKVDRMPFDDPDEPIPFGEHTCELFRVVDAVGPNGHGVRDTRREG